jgi:hypothetical protein
VDNLTVHECWLKESVAEHSGDIVADPFVFDEALDLYDVFCSSHLLRIGAREALRYGDIQRPNILSPVDVGSRFFQPNLNLSDQIPLRPLARGRVGARYGVPKPRFALFYRVRKLRPDVSFC